MGKYLITGRPGSGKTTVIESLKQRGFQAFNTDGMPEITKLEEQETGKPVPWPEVVVDWKRYIWNWQEPGLRNLLQSESDIFIGAIVGNQQKFYPLFDKIFALTISAETLQKRLDSHAHPRTTQEKERAIAVHYNKQARFEKQGLVLIPADGSVDEIIDHILAQLKK
jgi:dephospho-CoA kinase